MGWAARFTGRPGRLARIIQECRREAVETEALYYTRPPRRGQDAPFRGLLAERAVP